MTRVGSLPPVSILLSDGLVADIQRWVKTHEHLTLNVDYPLKEIRLRLFGITEQSDTDGQRTITNITMELTRDAKTT